MHDDHLWRYSPDRLAPLAGTDYLADADDVTRFRAYVAGSLAPTGLVLQVAECDDALLEAVFAQLPVCGSDEVRYQWVLDAVRRGEAPFAGARYRVKEAVALEQLTAWMEPLYAAALAGDVTSKGRTTRAAVVARRLPLTQTRVIPGSFWPSPGCNRPAGDAGDLVVDADGQLRQVAEDGANLVVVDDHGMRRTVDTAGGVHLGGEG